MSTRSNSSLPPHNTSSTGACSEIIKGTKLLTIGLDAGQSKQLFVQLYGIMWNDSI